MASVQVNLLFLACAVVLLYVSVAPVEAVSTHCGYHYHYNEYFTRYYSSYYRRYYPTYYGCCKNEVPTCRETKMPTFYIKTHYYGKRDLSAREVVHNMELQSET
ncbi:uncharacterized protein [Magallana gigas]|uniref:uncharacterized protein isoform X1 n=1 Tax=Magallana gigas TaxID=29159 RepID=UPI0033400499